jgi:hypothetical protein
MVFRATAIGGGGESESGSTLLSVAGEDVSGILLTTTKGGTAMGTVVFDGPRSASVGSIRVTSMAVDSDGPALGGGGASPKEDGSFELKGLSGPRLIRVANAPPGWTLKSVKLNGTDITDVGTEFKAGGVDVRPRGRASAKATSVTGVIARRLALADYTSSSFRSRPSTGGCR